MDAVNIREIQHYLYCPHRWGLIEIGDVWAENYYVVKADLLHKRVHNPDKAYSSANKKMFTSVPVWNDDINIFGVTDVIELKKDKNGVSVDNSGEKYALTIVEYKPTQPKSGDFNFDDAMQVFAQKLCVDNVFGCNCNAVIYYSDVKKRISLCFDDEIYMNTLKSILSKIEFCRINGQIPPIKKGQKCDGCSMKDLCMPKIKKSKNIKNRIYETVDSDL